MRLISVFVKATLSVFIISAGAVGADSSGHFGFRVGIGYDYISQEYFLDSVRYLYTDSSLTSALLKKDFLDDKKGFVYFKYDNRSYAVGDLSHFYEVGWEQTEDVFRLIGNGRIDKRWAKSRLGADIKFEMKKNYKGAADIGEDLTTLNGYLEYLRKLSNSLELKTRTYTESVNFDTVATYIYNYSRYGIELGLSHYSQNLNLIYLSSAFEYRNVPDSGDLDYRLFRSNFGYTGSFLGAQLNSDVGLELRDYSGFSNQDNYFLVSMNSELKIPLGSRFNFIPGQRLEWFNFEATDALNDDYFLTRIETLVEKEIGDFSVSLGPGVELMRTQSEPETDNDYDEWMAVGEAEYFNLEGLFIIFDNRFGKRYYKNSPTYVSDFVFNRTNLVASATILGALSFDILLSLDLEFHEIDSDDSRLYLISTGLSYQF